MKKKRIERKLSTMLLSKTNNVLNDDWKQKIKKVLPMRFQVILKELLVQSSVEPRLSAIKLKLRELGLEMSAQAELEKIIEETKSAKEKYLARRELALWYANQRNPDSAIKSLYYLSNMKQYKYHKEDILHIEDILIETENYLLLKETMKGKQLLDSILPKLKLLDLFFMRANFEDEIEQKIFWINKGLAVKNLLPISIDAFSGKPPYDCIKSDIVNEKVDLERSKKFKVSIIVPVYNAEDTIETALISLINQTWSNIEIIVVDDCSIDNTSTKLKKIKLIDKRIKTITTNKNSGAYVARNEGIKVATGDFITCNDSDDWSHPQKIETQITNFLLNPGIIANTSQQIRATSDLCFYRRGNFRLLIPNVSSLMFRRKIVMEKLGYLDSVRFAADSEFIRRIKVVFGKDSVLNLESGPLSFQRQSSSSLTGNEAFGYHGFFMGARKEYFESQIYFHKTAPVKKLYYEYPMRKRPFKVPRPLLEKGNSVVKLEKILIFDFRVFDRDIFDLIAMLSSGDSCRIGLIQYYKYDFNPTTFINEQIRNCLNNSECEFLVYGQKVFCESLYILGSDLLQHRQRYVPKVYSDEVYILERGSAVIENQVYENSRYFLNYNKITTLSLEKFKKNKEVENGD
ncbi:glycosyltransferase family 2 protein [Paenibacillus sp. IB182496]|uniref:Glycosyltransferase family 2 protein n=1 Tax=Paenibacillus sabuli TaxID=2772509 RepID=A0A927GS49_9BACL|nr:glycosyltransferase family 2 protein [Paenibacillus sabuli]MBD2845926.1 glycosyltransferase family 2 protein [Paenibacillus sabuli]